MSEPPRWLGLDIGGANLKAATGDGFARQVAFPLWKRPAELAQAIVALLREAPPHDALAVTMTGELADCFATKAEGVAAIVAAVEEAGQGRQTKYYAIGQPGDFVEAAQAVESWPRVAASNWHALATAAAQVTGMAGLLIDIGSTTTDLVPFAQGHPQTKALNDTDRLMAHQLLYQGVGRTPLCAVLEEAPYRGRHCPVAAEFFATTADVALLLGHAQPDATNCDTADGQPFTEPFSIARMARMICADSSQFNLHDAHLVARTVCGKLEDRLTHAIAHVLTESGIESPAFMLSGGGAWLGQSALMRLGCFTDAHPLAELIGEPASLCAPAWAVAVLAQTRDRE